MRSLVLSLSVLIMVLRVKMEDMDIVEHMDVLDNILVYPVPAREPTVKKREVSRYTPENLDDFLTEKLNQHTQALEHIVEKVDRHEETIKQLIEHLMSKTLEKPKLPTKIETEELQLLNGRRSNSYNEQRENPILRLGKNIPIYGRLAKDLFMKEIQSDTDPTPLVEANPYEHNSEYSRRSFGGSPRIDPSPTNKVELNPWCEAAMRCKKTSESICGFDDNYGYGKFDDICHMQHVNCYYKYNFVLAHTCNPQI